MHKVAIEDTLQNVKEYLVSKGYDVVNLDQQTSHVDAIIISGQDKDVLGMEDITTSAPVINAEGLTPNEVYQRLSNNNLEA